MKIIYPTYEILWHMSPDDMWLAMERFARISHRSEERVTGNPEDARKFVLEWAVENKPQHLTILECVDVTIEITHSIGIGREALRHRMMSPMQESTRFVNYSKENQGGGDIKFIHPILTIGNDIKSPDTFPFEIWIEAMRHAEMAYNQLISLGVPPQAARDVLPLATASKWAQKGNLSFWRDFLRKRTHRSAHPQMRIMMSDIIRELNSSLPGLFTDIIEDNCLNEQAGK